MVCTERHGFKTITGPILFYSYFFGFVFIIFDVNLEKMYVRKLGGLRKDLDPFLNTNAYLEIFLKILFKSLWTSFNLFTSFLGFISK